MSRIASPTEQVTSIIVAAISLPAAFLIIYLLCVATNSLPTVAFFALYGAVFWVPIFPVLVMPPVWLIIRLNAIELQGRFRALVWVATLLAILCVPASFLLFMPLEWWPTSWVL